LPVFDREKIRKGEGIPPFRKETVSQRKKLYRDLKTEQSVAEAFQGEAWLGTSFLRPTHFEKIEGLLLFCKI
jgi:hypothetical protein